MLGFLFSSSSELGIKARAVCDGCECFHVCVLRSEDNFMELVFSFNLYMSSENQTQVVRLVWETPLPRYLLSPCLRVSSLPFSPHLFTYLFFGRVLHYADIACFDSIQSASLRAPSAGTQGVHYCIWT